MTPMKHRWFVIRYRIEKPMPLNMGLSSERNQERWKIHAITQMTVMGGASSSCCCGCDWLWRRRSAERDVELGIAEETEALLGKDDESIIVNLEDVQPDDPFFGENELLPLPRVPREDEQYTDGQEEGSTRRSRRRRMQFPSFRVEGSEPLTGDVLRDYHFYRALALIDMLKKYAVKLDIIKSREMRIAIKEMFLNDSPENSLFNTYSEEFVPDNEKYRNSDASRQPQLRTSMEEEDVNFYVDKLGLLVEHYLFLKEERGCCGARARAEKIWEIEYKMDEKIYDFFADLRTETVTKVHDAVIDRSLDGLGLGDWRNDAQLCALVLNHKAQLHDMDREGPALIAKWRKLIRAEEHQPLYEKLRTVRTLQLAEDFGKDLNAFGSRFENMEKKVYPFPSDSDTQSNQGSPSNPSAGSGTGTSFLEQILEPLKNEDYPARRTRDKETRVSGLHLNRDQDQDDPVAHFAPDPRNRLDHRSEQIVREIYKHFSEVLPWSRSNPKERESLRREIDLLFSRKKAGEMERYIQQRVACELKYTLPLTKITKKQIDSELTRLLTRALGLYKEHSSYRKDIKDDYALKDFKEQSRDEEFYQKAKAEFTERLTQRVDSLQPYFNIDKRGVKIAIFDDLARGIFDFNLQRWKRVIKDQIQMRIENMEAESAHTWSSRLHSDLASRLIAGIISNGAYGAAGALVRHYFPATVTVIDDKKDV